MCEVTQLGSYFSLNYDSDYGTGFTPTSTQVIDMNGRLNTIYKKLNNKNFIDRAPSDVIANEKKKKEKYEAMLKKLEENLNALIK